ncbi:MAG: hypothetical protein R3275_07520 [Saprospiraceae bacterium]|nr:hypothetical protein [Saprospiraceae bacterium]
MKKLGLNDQQWVLLVDAFPKIAVMIGAADGRMDDDEKAWSKKLTHIRTFAGNRELFELYQDVEEVIGERIETILDEYSDDPEARERMIVSQLEMINSILASMPEKLAAKVYEDLRSFALHVAKASGGFLRFFSVSKAEKDLAELPMIDEIVYEEEE